MYFTLTFGTLLIIISGMLFVFLIRAICRRGVIGERIGLIDKYMLVSLFLHIAWAFAVGLLSHYGYRFLVWDDETYHNFAMRMIDAPNAVNLYHHILRSLYDIFGRTTVTGRLVNLFFSVATIYPLATVENRLDPKTNYSATRFFAYSPFMIFISYFEIKDVIILFCYTASYALVKRLQERSGLSYLLLLLAICAFAEQLRTGTGVLPVGVLVLSKLKGFGRTKTQRRIFAAASALLALAGAVYIGQAYLIRGINRIERYQNWIFTQFSDTSIYNWFVITRISDLWKLPFCFLLYALQPLDMLSGNMRYFSEFGMIAKAIDAPILFFSILFLPRYIKKEKWNSLLFVALYAFNSCINLTNARQGFFIYPIMYLIFFDGSLSFETMDPDSAAKSLYGSGKNWRLYLAMFYAVWIMFVFYRLVF